MKKKDKEIIYNKLLETVWVSRWTENKQALYAVLTPEEAVEIVNNIFKDIDKLGFKIIKK
jgi:hypothetical protein